MEHERKEKMVLDKPTRAKSKEKQQVKKEDQVYSDLFDNVEAKFSVMERAGKVLARLENDFPCFVKCMLPSNVAHGFWLHLPKRFCNLYLPNRDATVVLVDEWENEYKTSYLLSRHGLSAGWRGFSISHRLLKGDMLIFHLVEPCKLKVNIVRVNRLDVMDAALCLLNMNASGKGMDCEDTVKNDNRKRKKVKYVDSFLLDTSTPPESTESKGKSLLNSSLEPVECQSRSNSDGFSSQVGEVEGSEITNHLRSNDLCYSGSSFLHDHPHESVPCM